MKYIKKKEKIRKIFLEKLPKWESGTNKGKINWKESVGYKVKFIYDNIEGEIEIVNYQIKGQKLNIRYLNKEPFKINSNDFQKCRFGNLLGKRTNKFKIEIGVRFQDDKRDLTIIDRKYKRDKKGQNWKYYKYKCNKCGFECGEHYINGEYKKEYWIEESRLLNQKQGCSCCDGRSVVKGINDIPTTNPEMVKYFQGGYDEAKKYTKCNTSKIYPICPDCGRIKKKKIGIYQIYTNKSIGCSCSDGQSYPNKFMYSVLEQLYMNFEPEYSPNWIKPKRFDFYFELNNKKYIIEMDGGLGHGKKDNPISGQTKEKSQTIDDEKDKLADKHGVTVIRIDCCYIGNNKFEYIKNNILIKLNNLFDLNSIDWNKAEKYALSNLVKKACEIKKDNPNITCLEIGKILNLSNNTIIEYLKQGNKLGWCNYNPKEEHLKTLINNGIKNGKKFSKKVEIFKNGISLGIFPSCAELERQSEKLFGVKLSNSQISTVCNKNSKRHRNSYKSFNFRYIN